MRIITKVEYIDVPEEDRTGVLDTVYQRFADSGPCPDLNSPMMKDLTIIQEHIHGKIFNIPNGEKFDKESGEMIPDYKQICLGLSKESKENLYIPFQVIDNLDELVESLRASNFGLKTEVRLLKKDVISLEKLKQEVINATLWTRLKYLFFKNAMLNFDS